MNNRANKELAQTVLHAFLVDVVSTTFVRIGRVWVWGNILLKRGSKHPLNFELYPASTESYDSYVNSFG